LKYPKWGRKLLTHNKPKILGRLNKKDFQLSNPLKRNLFFKKDFVLSQRILLIPLMITTTVLFPFY
jgi:hypothetical protein